MAPILPVLYYNLLVLILLNMQSTKFVCIERPSNNVYLCLAEIQNTFAKWIVNGLFLTFGSFIGMTGGLGFEDMVMFHLANGLTGLPQSSFSANPQMSSGFKNVFSKTPSPITFQI